MSFELLSKAQVVFWDFDGVIKESASIKSQAYEQMFSEFGNDILEKVMKHHHQNGGISREKKIPLYFKEFAGINLNAQDLENKCHEYSKSVVQEVIDAPWIKGVLDYLTANHHRQTFVLITGTPLDEIKKILKTINIIYCFKTIYGSPISKIKALEQEIQPDTDVRNCLFIGDATTDFEAANMFKIPFLLRETKENKNLFINYAGPRFNDFQQLNATL